VTSANRREAPSGQPTDVCIIGAGAVGASIALELTRRGATVTVLERDDGWGPGCSSGNAGLLCPSHAGHFATRADIVSAMRWILRSDSPFGLRPRPALIPFAVGLLRSTNATTAKKTAHLLRELSLQSLELHETLARDGLTPGFTRNGLLDVYTTQAGLARARQASAAQARAGLDPQPLTPSELLEIEPALSPGLAGGILYPHEAHLDPADYVQAIGTAAEQHGATLVAGADVADIERHTDGCRVHSTRGPVIARAVVIAAGSWSGQLTRTLGYRLPLEAGKGYSLDLETPHEPLVRRPLMLQEARVAITPLRQRLRLAGTMQLDGLDLRIQPTRTDAIRAAATRRLPGSRSARVLHSWAGLRPCTPDGLPMIGWLSKDRSVAVATGHAMLGVTLAPISARLTADLLEGRSSRELQPLAPSRFSRA
jgi:D-amino-acid dehydrogenase